MDIVFEILSRLISQKNGAVTDSMMDKGIIYKVSYGVALHTIKRIAGEYAPDHELARQLYERDEREAKLAAIFIEDPKAVSTNQLELWANDFSNTELAEVACSQLLYKTPYALPYSYQWCQSPHNHLQRAGWIMVAKAQPKPSQLARYLSLVETSKSIAPSVQPHIIQALVKLAGSNNDLYEQVTKVLPFLREGSQAQKVVAKEISAFLALKVE